MRAINNLLRQASRIAGQCGRTLSAVIKRGLHLLTLSSRRQRPPVRFPVSRVGGGVHPGVDLNNSAALLDMMEGRR